MTKIRALMATLMIVGVIVLLGGMSIAQQDQNTNGNTNANASGRTGGDMSQSANANANTSASQNTMAKSSDGKFMMTAAAGGMAEVEMARLALERASSDGVKQYAQRMIDDHTRANTELTELATAKGITLPTGPDAKHMALMEKLRQKSGADFDRMYLKEAGVKDHQNMEKLFRNETTKGKDADVKAFAMKTLPAVQEHLRMARDMSGTMTGTGSGTGTGANRNANTSGNSNANMNGNMNDNGNGNGNGNGNSNGNGNTNP